VPADVALPSFILGYHGCDASLAADVVAGRTSLTVSTEDYHWLGDGIYFWEHNAQRAHDFAKAMADKPHPSGQTITEPAVVGAVIDLGYCLNLLDSGYIAMLRQAHDDLVASAEAMGESLPRNTIGADLVNRKLDCAVIRSLHERRAEAGKQPFDAVRAVFFEGQRLYENAGFFDRNHIQVSVRDPARILGYFLPRDDDGQPRWFG